MSQDQQGTSRTASSSYPSSLANIRVKTMSDRECVISIDLNSPVSVLQDKIHEKLGMDPSTQRLIFQAKQLQPNVSLMSYGIKDGYTIHLVHRASNAPAEIPQESIVQRSLPNFPNLAVDMLDEAAQRGVEMIGRQLRASLPSTFGMGNITPQMDNLSLQQANNQNEDTVNAAQIRWRLFLSNTLFSKNRAMVEASVRKVIHSLPYLSPEDREKFAYEWSDTRNEMSIFLPQINPHIVSPAFERLSFVERNVRVISANIDIINEEDGLLSIIRRVMRLVEARNVEDGVADNQRIQLRERINDIMTRLDSISTSVTSNRQLDRERLRNATPEQRSARMELVGASADNPSFVMRHAIDTDLTESLRQFRAQQRRFFELEQVLEEMIDTGAIPFIKNEISDINDYRSLVLSVFYDYIMKLRHLISHITHVSTEIEVPFLSPTNPQRLLPQYDVPQLVVPHPYTGILTIKFRSPNESTLNTEPVATIFTPPKIRNDVAQCVNGEWPYLTFYAVGALVQHHEVSIVMPISPQRNPTTSTTTGTSTSTQGSSSSTSRPGSSRPARSSSESRDSGRDRDRFMSFDAEFNDRTRQPRITRRALTSGLLTRGSGTEIVGNVRDFISSLPGMAGIPTIMTGIGAEISLEATQPPPSATATATSSSTSRTRSDLARGPETQTLSSFPQQVPPNDLHNIARNIASRYRVEAIQRIARDLTRMFNEQVPSWDVRLESAPIGTLREMLALCLELLTSSGTSLEESKSLMLALVHSESVLTRAVFESMRSLFIQGQFPTHVSRIILPRNEPIAARTDYDVDEDSDGIEDVPIRMPTDVSQPQSGSLRDLARVREERRRLLEASLPNYTERPRAPRRGDGNTAALRVAAGRPALTISLVGADHLDIQSGRLPTGPQLRTLPLPLSSQNQERAEAEREQTQQGEQGEEGSVLNVEINLPSSENTRSTATATVESSAADSTTTTTESVAQTAEEPTPEEVDASADGAGPSNEEGNFDNVLAFFMDGQNGELARTTENRNQRQSVNIDPFLNCPNRHSEVNRANGMPVHNNEPRRVTERSMQPDPELAQYTQTNIPRTEFEMETVANDPDFTYNITRHASGELTFEDSVAGQTEFENVVRTALRSLFGEMNNVDSVLALHNISTRRRRRTLNTGVPRSAIAAQTGSLRVHHSRLPAIRVDGRQRTMGDAYLDMSTNDEFSRLQVMRYMARNGTPFLYQYHGRTVLGEYDMLTIGRLFANIFERFASNHSQRPRGLIGLLFEIFRLRSTVREVECMTNLIAFESFLGRHRHAIRQHIVDNQFSGNARPSEEDLRSISERLATPEHIYAEMIHPILGDMSSTILVNGSEVPVERALRLIEVGGMFEILQAVSNTEFASENFVDAVQTLVERVVVLINILCDSDRPMRNRFWLTDLPRQLTSMFFPSNGGYYDFANGFRVLFIWAHRMQEGARADLLVEFLNAEIVRRASSTSSESLPRTPPRPSNTPAGGRSPKRRKCDSEEMEVDQAEEVTEDFEMDRQGNNEGPSS